MENLVRIPGEVAFSQKNIGENLLRMLPPPSVKHGVEARVVSWFKDILVARKIWKWSHGEFHELDFVIHFRSILILR